QHIGRVDRRRQCRYRSRARYGDGPGTDLPRDRTAALPAGVAGRAAHRYRAGDRRGGGRGADPRGRARRRFYAADPDCRAAPALCVMIEIDDVTKYYGDRRVVDGLSLTVPAGDF